MPDKIHAKVSGVWRDVEETHARVSGAWRRCPEAYVKVSGAWRLAHSDLAASKSGDAQAPHEQTVTNGVTITAALGAPGYAYSWARVSGSTVPEISNPTGFAVSWSIPSVQTASAVWRCTVTDSHGLTTTVDVNVVFLGSLS